MVHTLKTLSETLSELSKKGYNLDFNLRSEDIYCKSEDLALSPEKFEIDEVFRFEGMTNPDDESILYAISAKDGSVKGVIVDAYGTYADPLSQEMITKLASHKH